MPLPWKKTRVNRISQFVSDLQPPKRGGSFVVQTGFPASLIDLIFKNRDHLKKPPSKKHKNKSKHKKKKANRADDRVGDWIAADSELGPADSEVPAKPSSPKVEALSRDGGEAVKSQALGETHDEEEDREYVGGRWDAAVLAAVKMFAVVVLALSTKKLAVGITLSAFLLLLLEYMGKKLACFLRPCSNAKFVFRSMGQRVCRFVLISSGFDGSDDLKGVSVKGKSGGVVCELVDEYERSESDSAKGSVCFVDDEFFGDDYERKKRVVEKGDGGGEKSLNELLEVDCEERRAFSDKKSTSLVKLLGGDYEKIKVVEGGGDGGEDKKSKGGKNSKIKSKLIKKFVPKKLRRKGKRSDPELQPLLSTEVSGFTVDDDRLEGCEGLGDRKDVKQEEQESENMSVFSLDVEAKSEYQGFDEVSDHGDGALAGEETPLVVEKKGREGQGSLGYMILFLIVLAGLFGGRIVALMLTIGCCFMPKLAGSLRRFVKYAHGKVFCPNLKLEYPGLS